MLIKSSNKTTIATLKTVAIIILLQTGVFVITIG
jgi:hypothetical protein